ncbi:hypothetical protein [Gynuella sp.]|uniref:hypothetical protein n=1 Tax=Gynuella sp. TaxID=2969146 RepID=UPI003D0C55C5
MEPKKTASKTDRSLLEQALVKSATLTRCAVNGTEPDPNHVVMKTEGEVAMFDKGVTIWKLDVNSPETLIPATTDTPYVEVEATWLNTQQALEQNVDVIHGGSANTFGGVGALLLPDDFRIPAVVADKDNVRHYDLQLLANDEVFSPSSKDYEIVMMRYEYSKDYKKDFLMQTYGGGGVFVETHDFPHIHIPLDNNSGGYIVIGKLLSNGRYQFTAFNIPFGYALYTPSYTIHGDGTLVGKYGITVGDSAFVSANTVLMYNKNSLTMALDVVPDWQG